MKEIPSAYTSEFDLDDGISQREPKALSSAAFPAKALSAEERLEQSRQQIRGIFSEPLDADETESRTATDNRAEAKSGGNTAVELANSLLKQWWDQHPWRVAMHGASEVTQKVARDTAQQHPMRLVAGAIIAGALVAKIKPWRAVSGGTVVRGLLLGAGAGVKAGGLLNARAVLHSAVDVLASNVRRTRHRVNAATEAALDKTDH